MLVQRVKNVIKDMCPELLVNTKCPCIRKVIYKYRMLKERKRCLLAIEKVARDTNKPYKEVLPDDFWLKYKRITICFLEVGRIGPMMETYIEISDDRFDSETEKMIFIPVYSGDNGRELFPEADKIANQYIFLYICRNNTVLTKENVSFWNDVISNHKDRVVFDDRYSHCGMINNQALDVFREYSIDRTYMFFSAEENNFGSECIRKMGISGEYICFFARGQKYLNTILKNNTVNANDRARNCSVDNFRKMTQDMNHKGIQSVRVGYMAEGNVNWPGVIDYANQYRSDFMDFYIIAKSKFLVTCYSGIQHIATLYNVPAVFVNAHLTLTGGDEKARILYGRDIVIYKKMRAPDGHLMPLREILDFEIKMPNQYERMSWFFANGYNFVDNTEDEINDVVCEMVEKLDGTAVYSYDDIVAQKKYRDMVMKAYHKLGRYDVWYPDMTVGRDFLRNNPWFLE